MNDAKATGAKVLISKCPFCRRNLLDGRDDLKMDIYVDDLVVLIANLMGSQQMSNHPHRVPQKRVSATCSGPRQYHQNHLGPKKKRLNPTLLKM